MLNVLKRLFGGRDAKPARPGSSLEVALAGRRHAETGLHQSEEQFAQLVAGVRDYAVFLLDRHGNVRTWNAGAERIKGYRPEDIIGQHFSRFYPPDAVSTGWPTHELEVAGATGRFEDEGWRVRKDGSLFWANVIITALRDESGSLRGFLKITRDLTDRKQAEEKLRLSEERFRLMVEGIKDYAIFMLGPDGRVATWNSGAERLKGYRAEEIIGQHFSRFYPQEVAERGWPEEELRRATAEGRFEDEGWRVRKDGSLFWANVIITALRDQAGILRGFSKITRDLSERKKAEDKLRQANEELECRVEERTAELVRANAASQAERERFRTTLESIGDAVIATDAEGRITFLNPVAELLTGWGQQEAEGRLMEEVFHAVNEDTHQPLESPAQAVIQRGQAIELTTPTVVIARDGTERPIDHSAAPIRDDRGGITGSVLVFHDITARRQMEKALRQSEARFRQLADQMPQLVWMARPDGHIYWYNKRWYEYTGTTPEQVEGWGWQSLHDPHELPRVLEKLRAHLERGQPWEDTFPLRRHDGEYHPFLSRATPLRAEDGRILQWFGTSTDISEQKRIEEEVRRLNAELEQRVRERTAELETANKELEAFSYSVSHDLRAPLRAIDGFSRILLQEHAAELSADAREFLHLVRNNTSQMGRLVDDLLTFSRLSRQPIRKHRVEPADIVRQCLAETQAEREGRQVEVVLGDLAPCHAEPSLLKQVWMNLISNALKYTRKCPAGRVEVGCRSPVGNGEVIYYVKDNGVGFDMRYAHKLFGVFQRLHRPEDYEGTGVGLAIVQRIVHRHGGRVWAEAELGRGATFSFTLGKGGRRD